MVDDDSSDTLSLTSTFVLDLWTDRIVAEYTGRKSLADENFEMVRKLCIFYNAKCLYENNKKGIYSYFSQRNCIYMLAETPEYLRDKELIKFTGIGNKARGVNATSGINNYANLLIQQWLIKPVNIEKDDGNDNVELVTIPNLYNIKSRALLLELVAFNPDINVDRVRALGMLMLYREEKMILYQGNPKDNGKTESDYLGNDNFFSRNYDERITRKKYNKTIF